MKIPKLLGLALLTSALPGFSATELQPDTLKAWEDYIGSAESGMQVRLSGQLPFLWTDEAPGRSSLLQRGKTLVAPASGDGIRSVPGGLIHHWVGAVFIPGATLPALRAVLRDYGRYKDIYKPVVADSKVVACTDTDQRFSMVWQRRVLFITAAIEGEYQVHDFAVDSRRGYYIATTVQVREIEAYRRSGERLLPPGKGSGFIWRLQSIARYEERDGGVYLELEAIALTRDIPASVRWFVSPLVNHLSINSLTATLRQTRDATRSMAVETQAIASRSGAGRCSGNARPGGEK